MSWFWRGFQSAIFYYVSCAPCTKLNYQRKRRKQNRRERLEKSADEETATDIYKHPSPFSTNIYWREEMALGPGPPPKKGDRGKAKNSSSRELNTGAPSSSAGASSADTTLVVESIDATQGTESGEGWNRRRYQRPDEILWGFDTDDDGVSIGLSRPNTTSSGTHYTARNPAVNDLHPPVVSTQPTRKSETRWMLQPPPSAKVMEGKERAKRSRSVSGASHGSSLTASLARPVAERNAEDKAARAAKALTHDLHPRGSGGTLPSTPTAPAPQPDRSPRPSADSPRFSTSMRKAPTAPLLISEDPLRPPVLHIPSSSPAAPQAQDRHTALTPATASSKDPRVSLSSASSLHVLQELVSPHAALNARAPSPGLEAVVRLPRSTMREERESRLPALESWFPGGGWAFPGGGGGEGGKGGVEEEGGGRGEGYGEGWGKEDC
ncbi:hypothetical protein MMC13_004355 [Lambiella insularis]|nr:hypothetical protein [Lambiella insularis]